MPERKLSVILVCGALLMGSVAAPSFSSEHSFEKLTHGLVVRKLPDAEIHDASIYFPLGNGRYEYEVVNYNDHSISRDDESQRRIEADPSIARWQRESGNDLVEEWQRTRDGHFNIVAKIARGLGYRVEITPSLDIPAHLRPRQHWEYDSALSAYTLESPGKLAYRGRLHAQFEYLGQYELNTPLGTFPAILLSEQYEATIGLLTIHSKRYRFYTAHIGKVAEIEDLRVSTPLFYESENVSARVLVSYSADQQS